MNFEELVARSSKKRQQHNYQEQLETLCRKFAGGQGKPEVFCALINQAPLPITDLVLYDAIRWEVERFEGGKCSDGIFRENVSKVIHVFRKN